MASALLEESAPLVASQPTPPRQEKSQQLRWLPPLMLVCALGLSVWIYAYFLQNTRHLWWAIEHDRNAHYMYGLDLAMDLRHGSWAKLAHDFDRIRVWGPFHAVMVAGLQFFGGPDQRLAVLPSLAGWIMTIWFAFLIPRRLMTSGGNAAGIVAACLVAVSPAHRAFATDVMYESLGAGLSLAVLYCYIVALQQQTRRWGVALGAALTVLFLHKYNYWLLVVFGIVAGEFVRQPRAWGQFALSLCRRDRLPAWLWIELKQPLNWIALAVGAAALVVAVTGGGSIEVGDRQVFLQQPHNLVHLAYLAFFVRLGLWWWQTGSSWSRSWPPALRPVALWHGGVVATWFLLPKRLSYFLWFLSPANSDQQRESVPFLHGLPYYMQALSDDYLALPWEIYFFAGMVLLGFLACHKLRAGSAAIFCFFLIAAYLTCQHPMLKNRFMHTWIAAGFIIGAMGLVRTAQDLVGRIVPSGRTWAATIVCAALVGVSCAAFIEPGHAHQGGIKREKPSSLDIPETYLNDLADARHPTLFCNVAGRFLLAWTFVERHHHQDFTADVKNYRATFENNPEGVKSWLGQTRSDTLVVIDIPPESRHFVQTADNVDLAALMQVLSQQTAFVEQKRWNHPDGFTVTLWKKR